MKRTTSYHSSKKEAVKELTKVMSCVLIPVQSCAKLAKNLVSKRREQVTEKQCISPEPNASKVSSKRLIQEWKENNVLA
jgi:hypothetical protein